MLERAPLWSNACLADHCRRRSVIDKVAVAPVGRFGRPRGRGPAGRRRRSLLGLSACSAGQDAAVNPGVPDVASAHGYVGTIGLDVVFIESGGAVMAGESAPLRAEFTDDADSADQLVNVSTPAAGSVQMLDAVNGVVRLQLTDAYFPLPATGLVPVTFEFSSAGQVTLDVPVAAPRAPAP